MVSIKINHITINGISSLNLLSDICAICREHITDKCIKCQEFNSSCYSIVGSCDHAFHICCINSWLNNNSYGIECPICNKTWKLKEKSIINNN